jgi:Na+/H+ antiporter NhaD/arsenite permease-like protein
MDHTIDAIQSTSDLGMFWLATIVFVGTYLIIMTEKINRAIIALLGAGLLIIVGVLSQEEAIRGIDFGTLGLLAGMMVIVNITTKTGVFQYLAIWSAKKSKASPWGLLLILSVVTALCSALLDNVTTVLLIVPVIINITRELKVSAYPYLFSAIFASNIGGTATLIGDPPNIMIGSGAGILFNDFLLHTAPICVVVMIATLLPIYLVWGRKLHATEQDKRDVMALDEKSAIKDRRLLKHCLFVIALVIGGFILGHSFHLQPATIAMTGAAFLLLLENLGHAQEHHHKNVHSAFAEAEWVTLFFFVGLFILVAGIEKVGLIQLFADHLMAITHGDMVQTTMAILWGSAILSAFVDNIPFVATMIPMIKSIIPQMGGADATMPLWWALSLGACLGGNGTIIGASANLVVAGMSEKTDRPIRFVPYMLMAFPLMLMSIAICTIYMWLRYM